MDFSYEEFLSQLDRTHAHILGSSGRGKSKLLEWFCRELINRRQPFCLFDWHGTLAQSLVDYLASLPAAPLVCIFKPSDPDWNLPYNPFAAPKHGEDVSEHVSHSVDALIRAWGAANTDPTPRLALHAGMLFRFCADANQTLSNAMRALTSTKLQAYAAQVIQAAGDTENAENWLRLSRRSERDKFSDTESTRNRLIRFAGFDAIKRMTTFRQGNMTVASLLRNKTIFLGDFSGLPDTEARTFASLFIWDFFKTSMKLMLKRPYFLILDEFQHYLTPDIVGSFDETRKAGLRLVVAHQRFGQLRGEEDVADAIFNHALVSFAFGEMGTEAALRWAKEHMLDHLDDLPEQYISVEERLLKLAILLKNQAVKKAWVKISGHPAFQWEVPVVHDMKPHTTSRLLYLNQCREAFGIKKKQEAEAEMAASWQELESRMERTHSPRASSKRPHP